MTRPARILFAVWAAITVAIAASLLLIELHWGPSGFNLFIQQPPLTDLPTTLASVAVTWLLAGLLSYLLAFGKINTANVLTLAGFFLIAFLYLNILRERYRYGDYQYYVEAATNLLGHKPLPDTYFYLPLWATLLEPLVPLGEEGLLVILWLVNILALFLFYFSLQRLLERYGFSGRLAAIVTTLFLLINVPVDRTLGYVQVNLLVMVFILLSFLLYPRSVFLSGLSLALAVQLKTSPVVLVLAFLLVRDWRWLAGFAISFIGLSAIPVAFNGISPYFDYLNNIRGLTQSHDVIFHETSFDSFFRFILPALKINRSWSEIAADLSKGILAIAAILVMIRCVRGQSFVQSSERGERNERSAILLNAAPPLFVLMTLASPVVWEHHGLFVAVPFLLILKRKLTPMEWVWFGLAYFLEFILPTFDFFPWSYGRLIAPLIVLWLIGRPAKDTAEPSLFTRLNAWLDQFPPFRRTA